jgi:hypothetical protein
VPGRGSGGCSGGLRQSKWPMAVVAAGRSERPKIGRPGRIGGGVGLGIARCSGSGGEEDFFFFNSVLPAFEPCSGVCVEVRGGRGGEKVGEKPSFTHRTVPIGFDLGVLVALILMKTNFCVYFPVCIMVESSQRETFSWEDLS